MAVASSNNNLIAALSAAPAKAGGRPSEGEADFSASLNQQIQTRQNETSPAKDGAKPAESAEPSTPAVAESGNTGEAAEPGKTGDAAQPGEDGQSASAEAERAAAEQAQAAQAGNAALLAQLRNFVDQGLDAEQAKAEAGENPLLQHTGLAKTLLEQKADKAASASDLAAKLAADRQGLPLETSAAGQRASDAAFASQLEQSMQPDARVTQQLGQLGTQPQARSQVSESNKALYAVNQPVGSTAWDRAVGHKVVMMVSNQQQEVEMQLNPPNLGPLEVKLSLNQDQASLTFVAAHAPVREALQNSMPRLQEMLAESGIQLGQVNVQARNEPGQQPGQGESGQPGFARQSAAQAEEVPAVPAWRTRAMSALPGNVNLFV